MFPLFSPLVASMLNLAGPDLIIILLILASIAIVVFLMGGGFSSSRNDPLPPPSKPLVPPPPLPKTPTIAERLEQLNSLRDQGLITPEEFDDQRRRILNDV